MIERWTGLSASHVLAGMLAISLLLLVSWQIGRLVDEIRLARGDLWQIVEQRDRELEALQEALERAADEEPRSVRAETANRKRRRRERTQ